MKFILRIQCFGGRGAGISKYQNKQSTNQQAKQETAVDKVLGGKMSNDTRTEFLKNVKAIQGGNGQYDFKSFGNLFDDSGNSGIVDDVNVAYALYQTNERYQSGNCQKCTATFEALMRGYDVKAQQTFDPANDDAFNNWMHLFNNQEYFWIQDPWDRAPNSISKKVGMLENKIGELSDNGNSRGIIYVKWKGRNTAHVFNYIETNGEVKYYDGQTKQVVDINKRLSDTDFKRTMVSRVDNLDFNEQYIDKILEKR